jgi:hypothetical protein
VTNRRTVTARGPGHRVRVDPLPVVRGRGPWIGGSCVMNKTTVPVLHIYW